MTSKKNLKTTCCERALLFSGSETSGGATAVAVVLVLLQGCLSRVLQLAARSCVYGGFLSDSARSSECAEVLFRNFAGSAHPGDSQ